MVFCHITVNRGFNFSSNVIHGEAAFYSYADPRSKQHCRKNQVKSHFEIKSSCQFHSRVFFMELTISGKTLLHDSIFKGGISILQSKFQSNFEIQQGCGIFSNLLFTDSTISGNFLICNLAFDDLVDFKGLVVKKDFLNSNCVFKSDVCFNSMHVGHDFECSGSKFSGRVDFRDCEINSSTNFSEAVFESHPPDFHDSSLRTNIIFTLNNKYWPKNECKNREKTNTKTLERDKNSYERLSQIMNKIGKKDEEHFFFRKEMRAKLTLMLRFRKTYDESLGLNLAYFLFSNYGYSFCRPFYWLVFFWALFSLIFCAIFNFVPNFSHLLNIR